MDGNGAVQTSSPRSSLPPGTGLPSSSQAAQAALQAKITAAQDKMSSLKAQYKKPKANSPADKEMKALKQEIASMEKELAATRQAAQPAQDHLGTTVVGIIGQQGIEPAHFHVGEVGQRLLRQAHALFQRKHRHLFRIGGHGDNHVVKQARGALDQITMTIGDRIKRAGIDGGNIH